MADSVIAGFDEPLNARNSLCGGAAWGLDLQLSDSLYAHGYSGLTYGGAVFSFSSLSSGNTIGVYYHTEIVDGKEISTPYPVKLGGSLALTGSSYSFVNNSAKWGGAIHAGDILFSGCSSVLFDSNEAIDAVYGTGIGGGIGGAINSTGVVLFDGCDNISFANNSAIGGAVAKASSLCFEDCANVSITNNSANSGVITGDLHIKGCSGTIAIRNNQATKTSGAALSGVLVCNNNEGKIIFESNVAISSGAIYSSTRDVYSFYNNSELIFRNNKNLEYLGGAFSVQSAISFDKNDNVIFSGNQAYTGGGAIFSGGAYGLTCVSFTGNSNVTFEDNHAIEVYGYGSGSTGGALSVGSLLISSNTNVSFLHNSATIHGGAISSTSGSFAIFEKNESLSFVGNNGGKEGGAIWAPNIVFSENSTVVFSENFAAKGGAVYGVSHSDVKFENNGLVKFSSNEATEGAAIYIPHNAFMTLSLQNNDTLLFENNKADAGAAIYAHDGVITISDNSRVQFIGNVSSHGASAIMAYDSSGAPVLKIVDNGVVEFVSNVQKDGASYAVRAEDLTISGNDYVCFSGNVKGLFANWAVLDTKQGVTGSCIEFCDDFYIDSYYNYKNAPTAFNSTGDGSIVLSKDANGEIVYDATLGGGSMEWEDRALLTVGGNYTIGSERKGASLVFNQSERMLALRSLTVKGNLTLQSGSDITFKLDTPTALAGGQAFVYVDKWLIWDKPLNIIVDAGDDLKNLYTQIPLITVNSGIIYKGHKIIPVENGWSWVNPEGNTVIWSSEMLNDSILSQYTEST